jgi:hypothetical protein
MSKYRRILFEILAPPLLATIWLLITSSKSETISGVILGFLPLLFFAYIFGIIPALLYTVAMELWFQFGLRVRCGLLCTVGLSAFLGAGAGFLSAGIGALLGFLIWMDCIHFLWIGASVGLLIGLCVGWRQTTVA